MQDPIQMELEGYSDIGIDVDPSFVRNAKDAMVNAVRNGGKITICYDPVKPADVVIPGDDGFETSYAVVPDNPVPCSGKDDVQLIFSETPLSDMTNANTFVFSTSAGNVQDRTVVGDLPNLFKVLALISRISHRELYGEKAVFVDRDSTLVVNVPYCNDPDKIVMLPGAGKAIARLNDAGYKAYLVTNQSGIGRGLVTHEQLAEVNARMCEHLARDGGHLDGIYYCPHHPDDGCDCRKPRIGMGVKAIFEHDINVSISYMIGDSDGDMGFGEGLGLRSIKVSEDHPISEAVDMILKDGI